MRAIRVRRCQTITLAVDEKDVSPQDSMEWYGVEHPKLPTLILSDRVQLTWSTLGKDLSRTVARLIDPDCGSSSRSYCASRWVRTTRWRRRTTRPLPQLSGVTPARCRNTAPPCGRISVTSYTY